MSSRLHSLRTPTSEGFGASLALRAPALAFCLVTMGAPVSAQENPVDRISNPEAVPFSDVELPLERFDAPFVRDGALIGAANFNRVADDAGEAEVRAILGEPIAANTDSWDYTFKFAMQPSGSYLVCQYKVIFAEERRVDRAVWRRRQCEALASE